MRRPYVLGDVEHGKMRLNTLVLPRARRPQPQHPNSQSDQEHTQRQQRNAEACPAAGLFPANKRGVGYWWMVVRDWGGIFFGATGRDGAEPRGKGNGRLVGEGLVWRQRYAELRSPVSELHQVFVCQDVIGPQPLAVDESPIGASQIP